MLETTKPNSVEKRQAAALKIHSEHQNDFE